MKSKLYIVAMFLISTLFSCTDKIESLEDLKNADFEQNPEIIDGFRLGVDSVSNLIMQYGSELNIKSEYCTICNKWRGKNDLEFDPHSFEYILSEEGNLNLMHEEGLPSDPKDIKIWKPNVFYRIEGGKYIRNVISDEPLYFDENGHSFEKPEPFISFDIKDKSYISNIHNIGVYTEKRVMYADFGKDTIPTSLILTFESFNNPPIWRTIYNEDVPYSHMYEKGMIVDLSANGTDFNRLLEGCTETYFTALNENEVNQVIKYFEENFGERNYISKNYSGDFNRKTEETFYRSYRWTKGIVNILLEINDYPPSTIMGMSKTNVYNKKNKGYNVTATFELNDEIKNLIKKENRNGNQ